MRLVAALASGIVFFGLVVAEDRLVLRDGQVVTGTILSENETDVQIDSGEETISVPTWAIDKIERGESPAAAADTPSEAPPRPAAESGPGSDTSDALLEWIDVCIEHLASDDEDVRRGASTALRAAGAAARPALERVAEGDDESLAELAQRILDSAKRPSRTSRSASRGRTRPISSSAIGRALGLSEEQQPKVTQILTDLRAKQTKISREVSGSEASEQIAALYEEANQELATVLTEEQMERYLEMTARHLSRRR